MLRFSDQSKQTSVSFAQKLKGIPDHAKAIVAGGATALLGTTCLFTGGVASVAFPLLMLAPLSGLIFSSLRAVKSASSMSLLCALSLPFATNLQNLPWGSNSFGVVTAGIAFGAATAFFATKAQHQLTQDGKVQNSRLGLLALQTENLVSKHDRLGSTLSVSDNAAAVTGAEITDLVSSGFYELVHLQDRVQFLKSLQEAALSGKPSRCQFRMRTKSAEKPTWSWMEIECFPDRDADSANQQVTAITKDISYLKMLESSLENSKQLLADANQTKQNFLGTVSHELRTPLNAIVGFSDILQEEIFGPLANDRQREHVSHIQEAGTHLLTVVNTMLDLSCLEAGKYELSLGSVDLRAVVKTCVTMLHQLSETHGVVVESDIPQSIGTVRGDENAIKQILINLLSNAIKFSPDGGQVSIKVQQVGAEFKLVVTDHGIGISEDFIAKIGKPFEQAEQGRDRRYDGTGLGLSVVSGFVELHQGKMEFDSVEGEGTVVTVTLPQQSRGAAPIPADETIKFIRKTDLRKSALPTNRTTDQTLANQIEKGENRARISA